MLVVVFTFYCHSYLPLECTDNVGRSPVNRNDLKELIPLLREEDLPADTPVYADKGYATEGIIISMISAFDIVELR